MIKTNINYEHSTGYYLIERTTKLKQFMVDKLKKSIEIPNWALAIICSIVIASFSFTYSFSKEFSAVTTQVEQHDKVLKEQAIDIKALEQFKADKELINNIYVTLERIENKLDTHIANQIK